MLLPEKIIIKYKLNQKVGFAIDELPYYIKRNPDNWIYMKMKIK